MSAPIIRVRRSTLILRLGAIPSGVTPESVTVSVVDETIGAVGILNVESSSSYLTVAGETIDGGVSVAIGLTSDEDGLLLPHNSLAGRAWLGHAHTAEGAGIAGWLLIPGDPGGEGVPSTPDEIEPFVFEYSLLGLELLAVEDAAAALALLEIVAGSESVAGLARFAANGGTDALRAVQGNDSRLTNSRTPTSHAASHQNAGSDEIATATPGANAIPKAGSLGVLAAGWLPEATAAAIGGRRARKIATGAWWPFGAQSVVGNTAGVPTANQLCIGLHEQEIENEIDQVAVEITVASGNMLLGLYALVNNVPTGLIWKSATIALGATGPLSTALTTGTWVDTSYKNGNNLRIPQGATIAFGYAIDNTTARIRVASPASGRILSASNAGGGGQVFTRGTATQASLLMPNTCPTLTGDGVSAFPFMLGRAA